MSKVILLNGASSSGKTSLARALQCKSPEPWLWLGIDTLIEMMPDQYVPLGSKADEGLDFLPGENEAGPAITIRIGPWGHQVLDCFPLIAQVFVQKGSNIIIDDVIVSKENLQDYGKALHGHTVYFVGVFCDLACMQEREILRGDRALGLSNGQINLVHPDYHRYDVTVDTTSQSSFTVAETILNFIQTHPKPESFDNIMKVLSKDPSSRLSS